MALLRVAVGGRVDLAVVAADAAQALEVETLAAEPWFGPNGVPRANQAPPAVATAKADCSGVVMVTVHVAANVIARQGWNDAVMVHVVGIVIAAIGRYPGCGKAVVAITT